MYFNIFVWIIGLLNLGYFLREITTCKQIAMRWLFCNKVNTVLLITVDLLVKKWQVQGKREWQRYWRKWRKGKGKWRCSSNYFPRPRLKAYTFLCDGHTNRLIGLTMFQNLLWVYGMAWMSVRFPGLKFCPSPSLVWVNTSGPNLRPWCLFPGGWIDLHQY